MDEHASTVNHSLDIGFGMENCRGPKIPQGILVYCCLCFGIVLVDICCVVVLQENRETKCQRTRYCNFGFGVV